MNGIVFTETRMLPGLREALERHTRFCDWPVLVLCSDKNRSEFKGYDKKIIKIEHISDYNRMFTSYEFWKSIPFDKVLVCQYDSGLLREGIEEFLDWDYVGAPFWFRDWGGNGGLSLRTVRVMQEITEFAKWKGLNNEDVWFCDIMQYSKTYRMAPLEVNRKFSVESQFCLGTLGYHAIHKFFTPEQERQILEQYG